MFLTAKLCTLVFAGGMWPRKEPKVTDPYYKGLEEVVPTDEELREQAKQRQRLVDEIKSAVIEQLEKEGRIGDVDLTPSDQ